MVLPKRFPGLHLPAVRWLAVSTMLVALTIVHTWPLAAHLGSHQQNGPDPKTMMSSLSDLCRNLLASPWRLMDGSFFYPYSGTLATLDHQISSAVMLLPATFSGAGGLTLYNLAVLCSFALSGLFTAMLARHLGASQTGSLIAGCAFAFAGGRVASLEHLHVLSTQWIPLALLAMHRYLDAPSLRRWVALVGAALLVAFTSWHIAIIGSVGIACVALFALAAEPAGRMRRAAGLVAVAAVCGAALLPLAVVYQRVSQQWPAVVENEAEWDQDIHVNSVDLHDLVLMPVESAGPYADVLSSEGPALFPGLVTLLLVVPGLVTLAAARGRPKTLTDRVLRWLVLLAAALCAVGMWAAFTRGHDDGVVLAVRELAPFAILGAGLLVAGLRFATAARRDSPLTAAVLAYVALGVCAVLLSMGPVVRMGGVDLGSGWWRTDLLPMPLPMRAPARFGVLLSLGLAVVAGLSTSRLLSMFRGNRAILASAALLVLNVDLAFGVGTLVPAPAASGVDRWLAESQEPGAVVEYPLHGHYWYMYASQDLYRRPNVHGLGLVVPPEVRRLLARPDFSEQQLEILLQSLHPRFLVVRWGLYQPAERQAAVREIDARGRMLRLRAGDGDDAVYELIDRSSGHRLERRWPARFLREGSRQLALSAEISEGRADTVDVLTVLLNGRVLQRILRPGMRPEHFIEIPEDAVVDWLNTFELRAGYQLAPGSPGYGLVDGMAPLRADLEAVAGLDSGEIAINGQSLGLQGGVQIAVIDPRAGEPVAALAFDGLREADVQGLRDALDAAAEGAVVVVLVAGTALVDTVGEEALRQTGLRFERPAGQAYAAVVQIGAGTGAIEQSGVDSTTVVVGTPERRRVQLRSLELR